MRTRYFIICLFVAVLAVPFLLRSKHGAGLEAAETLVIVTPHNEALRYEFGRGFSAWYREKTGRNIRVDWRVVGGTSEITRFLESEYTASFERYWTTDLHRPWSLDVQGSFQNGKPVGEVSNHARDARVTFLSSNVGCGIDLFFGGGTYDFIHQAQVGTLVDSGILSAHPEWFKENTIPQKFAGEEYWDMQGLWIGTVLSSYGLIYNRDALQRLHVPPPTQWTDLENPQLLGEIALADPTKSSSMAKVFENMIQQQMQQRLLALEKEQPEISASAREQRAVQEGWIQGLRLVQRLGANARYFTDTSQKPPIDVAQGDAAVGLCIDFYGRQQAEAVRRRAGTARIDYFSPIGGSIASVDPIGLLRGAPHPELAKAFIEYVLSLEGQKLWDFRPGTPGGPGRYALRRLSVRRDFYAHAEFKPFLSDPEDKPYADTDQLVYRPGWTGKIFREMAFVIRIMTLDTHEELVRAWQAIVAAGLPPAAVAELQNLDAIGYAEIGKRIHPLLISKDKTDEIKLARELGDRFRAQYARAESLARESLRK